jgi:hypothetical protein
MAAAFLHNPERPAFTPMPEQTQKGAADDRRRLLSCSDEKDQASTCSARTVSPASPTSAKPPAILISSGAAFSVL